MLPWHVYTHGWLHACCKFRSYAGEASTSLHLRSMDRILRQLEGLSRYEVVWLKSYLTGRLRALPPSGEQQLSMQAEVTTEHWTCSGD